MLCRSMPSDSKLHPARLSQACRVPAILLAIAVFQQVGFSQFAQITLHVTDASQAAVPAVSNTPTDEQTAVTCTTTGNEVGHYTLSLLRISPRPRVMTPYGQNTQAARQ